MKFNQIISQPVESIQGSIQVPGDKSISHRAILFGSIAQGTTEVSGFLDGEDCLATLAAFKAMGVRIEGPVKNQLRVHGVGKYGLKAPKDKIDCGNSGTTMRLLSGLLAAQPFDSQLTGDESLLKRPMLRISKPLTAMGAEVITQEGKPPLHIRGGRPLVGIEYVMPEASAQVKSALLLAGLYASGKTCIHETGISRDHSERMLASFSYPLLKEGPVLTIDSNSECQGTMIKIPGDLSSAAFFMVAASIIPGSNLLIRDVGVNPTRAGVIEILRLMGADIRILNPRQFGGEPVADVQVRYAPLKGIRIPESLVPLTIDEFPILFIAASCAEGETLLHGAKELRFKESDRIQVMVDGLLKTGIRAIALEDGVRIVGGQMQGAVINAQGDHRIAMSFAVAGAASLRPITILNSAEIATSFPGFVDTANSLHFRIKAS